MFQFRHRVSRAAAYLRRRTRARWAVIAGSVVVVVAIIVGGVASASPPPWIATFPAKKSLITNELDYSHPGRRGVAQSSQWLVTSGSLFSDDGAGWTGPIDGKTPDLRSAHHTGSAVFRAVTRRSDFQNVVVSFDLDIGKIVTTPRTGTHAYDGVHVFLRYTNPQSLYAVSIARRDGSVAAKIKRPGGPSNGGTYTLLGSAPHPVAHHQWIHEKVRIANERRGVRITWWSDGREILNVLSNGTGKSAPLRGPGRVGIRGDNTEFLFRNFTVVPL